MTDAEFAAEMRRQARAAFPNPWKESTHYPAPITINGVTRQFTAIRLASGKIFLFLHEERNNAERVSRVEIDTRGRIKHHPALARLSDALKFPGLWNGQWIPDEEYDALCKRMAEAASVEPQSMKEARA